MRDKNSFRQRYKYWKETGELPYSNGLKRELSNQALPEDSPVKSGIPYPMLTSSDYDDARAYELGYFDEAGAKGHLRSNDPKTDRILKSPTHPTVGMAIWGDMNMGRDVINKNGQYYSKPNFIQLKINKLPKYDGGKDGLFIKYVDSYRVNPDTGGVYDKVGEIKEGAVILPEVEVVGRPTGIEAMRREYDRISDIQRRQGLSGADPIGQFAVETAALNPVFKLAGTAGLYVLGRYGESLTGFARPQNWARGKLIAREMDRSPFGSIGSPALHPQVRTRVGDVEIDNPQLAYRLGPTVAEDFNRTGVVTPPEREAEIVQAISESAPLLDKIDVRIRPKTFNNPMFALGRLWYKSPIESFGSINNVGNAKQQQLIVTAEPLRVASKTSAPMNEWSNISGTFDVRDTGPLLNFDRRIPITESQLGLHNVSSYIWEPGYGYKRVFVEKPYTLNWADIARTPQITPLNAASITPEQWTAAQDAAIAKGVRIPLGSRDNFKLNDIRYGLLPFLGLGTTGSSYRTFNRRR